MPGRAPRAIRRRVALLALAAALVAAIGGMVVGARGGTDGGATPTGDRSGSTLRATWVDPDGDGALRRGPGEPLRNRTELAPVARPGRLLATLGVVTDAHVRDEESPARVSFLDRLGGTFTPTFRPQETLSTQTLAAALDALEADRPDLLLEAGDLTDDGTQAEYDQALAVLRPGARVDPDTGATGYAGPQSADDPDPTYYRPDVDPPRHPGLLDAAQAPFASPARRTPWIPVPGNHDVLASGEAEASEAINRIAVGSRILVRPRDDLRVPTDTRDAGAAVDDLIRGGELPGTTAPVAPDPRRRFLPQDQARGRLRAASELAGASAAAAGPGLSRVRDVGAAVRLVTLDLDWSGSGEDSAVSSAQVAFLRRALAGAGRRWVVVASHQPLASAAGGTRLLALLDEDPRVLLALAGHTHHHRVRARRTAAGGYFEVETASLADFPQQARTVRIRATAGGGAVVETWAVDTSSAGRVGALADTARELAYLDAQGGRPGGNRGDLLDRNVRLFKEPPR